MFAKHSEKFDLIATLRIWNIADWFRKKFRKNYNN